MTPFAGLQVPYSLLNRDIERELLPMAESLGLSVAAWATLAHGALSGRSDAAPDSPEGKVIEAVREVAAEVGATPSQVAIAWTMAKSSSVHPILGATRTESLRDNLGALDVQLPPDAIARLEAATGFVRSFPSDTALRGAGATQAIVCPRGDDAYPIAAKLYQSIGFRPGPRTATYTKRLKPVI